MCTDVPFLDRALAKYHRVLCDTCAKVTVFLKTHKRPHYLKETLMSVLSQSYRDFVVFVLDNCSHDETSKVCESFEDERLIYLERESTPEEPNYLFAFRIVSTDYLMVLHDDDLLAPNYLEQMILAMEQSKSLAALSCLAFTIDSEGKLVPGDYSDPEQDSFVFYDGDAYLVDAYFRYQKPAHCFPSALYRKSFFSKIDFAWNTNVGPAADQYVWFQVGRLGGITGVLLRHLYFYRLHDKQDSHMRAASMDFLLWNALLSEDYYRPLVLNNVSYCQRRIESSFFACLRAVINKTAGRRVFKDNYKLIAPEIARDPHNRPICRKYRAYGSRFIPLWLFGVRARLMKQLKRVFRFCGA